MTNLDERFRFLERTPSPDLWEAIVERPGEQASRGAGGTGWRRIPTIAAMLMVGFAAVVWVAVAVWRSEAPPPAARNDGAVVSLEHSASGATATLRYGDATREGIPVEILTPGQPMLGEGRGGDVLSFLGWQSASLDIHDLDVIEAEPIAVPADVRMEPGAEEVIILAFSQGGDGDRGWDQMTPLPVPTDLQMLDAGTRHLLVVVGRGTDDAAPQFAFAIDIADGAETETETETASNYVFSDVVAGPSKAEPQDLAVTFTVSWSTEEDPGVRECRFIAYASDGSIVGEFTSYYEWEPGRWYRNVPGDPEDAVAGEVRCGAERLDTPGLTNVEPIPERFKDSMDEIHEERERRLADWAAGFSVDEMSVETLAANLWAVWRSIPGAEMTKVWQLTDRMEYITKLMCPRIPRGHAYFQDFCT